MTVIFVLCTVNTVVLWIIYLVCSSIKYSMASWLVRGTATAGARVKEDEETGNAKWYHSNFV